MGPGATGSKTMEHFFFSFWWLIFPVGGMAYGAFQSWLKFRQQKAMMDLIRSYAEKGMEPPASLLRQLDAPLELDGDERDDRRRERSPAHYWSLVGLFAILAAGFGIAAWMGIDGHSGAFVIVSMVMAAVGVWSLINALFFPRSRS
jgi:Flp pilus assembly protein TadB